MIVTQTFEGPGPQVRKGSFLALVPIHFEQMQAQGHAPASLKISTRLPSTRSDPHKGCVDRFRPDDQLMAYLKAL